MKRIDPKIDPCGAPYYTLVCMKKDLFTFTNGVLLNILDRSLHHCIAASLHHCSCCNTGQCLWVRVQSLSKDLHNNVMNSWRKITTRPVRKKNVGKVWLVFNSSVQVVDERLLVKLGHDGRQSALASLLFVHIEKLLCLECWRETGTKATGTVDVRTLLGPVACWTAQLSWLCRGQTTSKSWLTL